MLPIPLKKPAQHSSKQQHINKSAMITSTVVTKNCAKTKQTMMG